MERKFAKKFNRIINNAPGILKGNPVLSTGLAIPFAVVCTTSLKNAVALSVAMFCATIPVMLLASLLGNKIPGWLRLAVYPVVSSLILMPILYWVYRSAPAMYDSLGIYLPLVAVNTVLVSSIFGVSRTKDYKGVFKLGVFNCTGFALAICFISFLRELFGYGTIWGIAVPFITFKIPGILIPFGGFIILGFLVAFFRFMRRVILYRLINKEQQFDDEEGMLPASTEH